MTSPGWLCGGWFGCVVQKFWFLIVGPRWLAINHQRRTSSMYAEVLLNHALSNILSSPPNLRRYKKWGRAGYQAQLLASCRM